MKTRAGSRVFCAWAFQLFPQERRSCFDGKVAERREKEEKTRHQTKIRDSRANLKKVLALVLAFACAFTMFAGAAFTDQADIKATDAVDMLVALGVVDGFEDGSFQPNGTVTRAQMAKMIYVLRTGKSDASAYNNDKTSFTDINGHWAAGYIKYCQSLGIIAGKSSTVFAPNATVTAQEAAKMLLVTLGYDATKAGLTGAGWAAKTNALADENGLLKDVNTSFTAACPRQYAAQLIYNTVFAPTVVWRDDAYQHTNVLDNDNQTVGEKYMNLVKESAGILYTCSEVDGKDYYTITTAGGQHTYTKVPVDVSELLGQNVKVLVKHDNNGNYDKAYGVYADEDSKVIANSLLGDFELDGTDKIKLDGTSYKLDQAQSANVVYTAQTTTTSAFTTLATAAAKGTITPTTAATEIKLIDNDGNGKVDAAVVTPTKVAKVTAVSKTSVTLDFLTAGEANATIKFEDADVYDGIKKDDFVAVIDDAYLASDNDLIYKLDVTSAKADSTRTNEVKANGDWYKLAREEGNVIAVTTGNTYDFVIVGNVVVDADETAASASNIAYISGVKSSSDDVVGSTEISVKVRMYFQDGTDAEVKISKLDGEKLKTGKAGYDYANIAALANKMVTFSKLSDGTYDVKAVGASNKVGMDWQTSLTNTGWNSVSGNSGTKTSIYYDQKISGFSVADDAVVFVQTQSETKMLSGKQIKNWADNVAVSFAATNSQVLTKDSNGIAYVKFATLVNTSNNADVPGASNDKKYGYLTADPYQADVDGEKKAAYDVWNGSENVTLYVDASNDSTGAKAGNVISYSEDGKFIDEVAIAGKYDKTTFANSVNIAAITGVNGDTIAYKDKAGTVHTYDFDDDCVFIAVNDDKTEGMEGSKDTITKANEFVDSGATYYVPNAYVITDVDGSDTVVVAVIFDADDSELDVTYATGNHASLISKS